MPPPAGPCHQGCVMGRPHSPVLVGLRSSPFRDFTPELCNRREPGTGPDGDLSLQGLDSETRGRNWQTVLTGCVMLAGRPISPGPHRTRDRDTEGQWTTVVGGPACWRQVQARVVGTMSFAICKSCPEHRSSCSEATSLMSPIPPRLRKASLAVPASQGHRAGDPMPLRTGSAASNPRGPCEEPTYPPGWPTGAEVGLSSRFTSWAHGPFPISQGQLCRVMGRSQSPSHTRHTHQRPLWCPPASDSEGQSGAPCTCPVRRLLG